MSAATKDKLEFTHALARHTQATVRQCEALMRYAGTLQRLAEDDCNVATDEMGLAKRESKRQHIQAMVIAQCICLTNKGEGECMPLFSGDPRGAVLKIRVPDGFVNDAPANEGIVVPS